MSEVVPEDIKDHEHDHSHEADAAHAHEEHAADHADTHAESHGEEHAAHGYDFMKTLDPPHHAVAVVGNCP